MYIYVHTCLRFSILYSVIVFGTSSILLNQRNILIPQRISAAAVEWEWSLQAMEWYLLETDTLAWLLTEVFQIPRWNTTAESKQHSVLAITLYKPIYKE